MFEIYECRNENKSDKGLEAEERKRNKDRQTEKRGKNYKELGDLLSYIILVSFYLRSNATIYYIYIIYIYHIYVYPSPSLKY